jgi:hypothetical protein
MKFMYTGYCTNGVLVLKSQETALLVQHQRKKGREKHISKKAKEIISKIPKRDEEETNPYSYMVL